MKIKIIFFLLIFCFSTKIGLFAQDDSEENVTAEMYSENELKEEMKFLNFQSFLMEAIQQRAIENFDKALENLENAEKIFPNEKSVLFEKAKNLFSLNKLEEAELYCDKTMEVDSNNFWVKSLKRDIYVKKNNFTRALEIQKELYEERSSEAEKLLKIYMLLDDKENGKSLLDEVEKRVIYVESIGFYKNHFLNLKDENLETDNENIQFSQKNTKNESNSLPIEKMNILVSQHHFEELNELADKILETQPTQPIVYWYKAKSLFGLTKYAEALKTLEIGLDFVFDDTTMLKNFYEELAKSHLGLGNKSKAEQYRQMAQKLTNK